MRSPWNGGSSSLRWRRCSAPSSSSVECGPDQRPQGALPSPALKISGSPRKTCLIVSGFAVTHIVRSSGVTKWKKSPCSR